MKRFYLAPVSAGLALAIMSGPLAMAQQYPNHDDTHGNSQAHSTMQDHGMQHTSMPHVTMQRPTVHVTMQHGVTHGMIPQHPQARVQPMHAPQPIRSENHMPQTHQTAYSSHAASSHTAHDSDHHTGSHTGFGG
jgi:hypothetical protein